MIGLPVTLVITWAGSEEAFSDAVLSVAFSAGGKVPNGETVVMLLATKDSLAASGPADDTPNGSGGISEVSTSGSGEAAEKDKNAEVATKAIGDVEFRDEPSISCVVFTVPPVMSERSGSNGSMGSVVGGCAEVALSAADPLADKGTGWAVVAIGDAVVPRTVPAVPSKGFPRPYDCGQGQ